MITHEGRIELFRSQVGSVEYNLNNSESDNDFKIFVLPTFDDLYFGNSFSKMYLTENGDFDVNDIRKLYKMLYNSNIGFLGSLYSDMVLINASLSNDVKKLIRELFEMKDEISRINLSHLFDSTMGIHNSYLREMEYVSKKNHKKISIVEKYGYNTKAAMSTIRTLDFIIKFANNDFTNFKSCYKYEDNDPMRKLLLDIRNGKYSFGEFQLIHSDIQKKAELLKPKYKSFNVDEDTNYKLKALFKNIIKESLKDN